MQAPEGQIRGSTLLLAGRLLMLGINFGIQVLVVRYLSKGDYGAFAYALSVSLFAQTVITLSLDRAVTRFVPIYLEHRAYDRVLGMLILVAATLAGLALTVVTTVYLLVGPLGVGLAHGGETGSLLLILITLAPLEAASAVFLGLFAVFSRPRAIFFRRYVLASSLRLVTAVVLVASGSSVQLLAVGYVLTGAVGLAICVALFVKILRADGLLAELRRTPPLIPAREVLSFTVPLLTTDLVYGGMMVTDVVLLGHFRGADSVATLRAIQPAAQMNQLVFSSFIYLYTPSASRLFARGDRRGIDDLYWNTAGWIAILTSPVFLLTFSLAPSLTTVLFGARYSDSAVLLSILAVGYYVQAALGYNGTTLMVVGAIGPLVALNIAAIGVNLGANLIAIPKLGALGAAIATGTTLLAHNLLKQAALQRVAGVRFFRAEYARVYVAVVAAAAALAVLQAALGRPALGFAVGAVLSLLLLRASRHILHLEETFPELFRLPLLRRVLVS